ncbi:transmembrane protein 216-like [Gigantopelta aegis]|uniref:transmembrane protein 216-like n=1 Tax=Gigantopelta aegis TaxID=1735272 RepID=UPI001B88C15E|nr:transmembrane protein 216-like [Gigantopelta aegis]
MATGQIARPGHPRAVTTSKSSLPYQVILYLNGFYFAFFFIAEILIYIFKGETLPYATNALAAEVVLVFILAGVEALRLCMGGKGNLTENALSVISCLLFTLPALFGTLFILLWQTYVLRIEVILAAIQLAFIGLELIFSIIACITFASQ